MTGVRIIAGELKGRRIVAPRGAGTRPTSDRVREALFNIIGPVDGASVLDLFAGSGSLGLEALSRGARRCVFVDNDSAACRAIRDNIDKLGVADALVIDRDAVSFARGEAGSGRSFDLVLIDAPYERWVEVSPKLAEAFPNLVSEDGLVVVETDSRVEPQLPLAHVTTRRYGSARLTIFSR